MLAIRTIKSNLTHALTWLDFNILMTKSDWFTEQKISYSFVRSLVAELGQLKLVKLLTRPSGFPGL